MVERWNPIVTELALADALYQLINLIEELRVDVRSQASRSPSTRPTW